jgi:hypothetical protein
MSTSEQRNENEASNTNRIVFFVDNVKFATAEETLTAGAVLELFAKEDPALTTLTLVNGKDRKKYEDANTVIRLKNGMRFVVLHNGPTTVS